MADLEQSLRTVGRILGWCLLFGIILLLVWSGAFFGACGLIERQAAWFGLTPHECAVVAYAGMGLAKMLTILFFFFPWLAIRLVLRRRGA